MEFKSYSPEEHGEHLPDVHRPFYAAPSEPQVFVDAAEEAFQELEELLDFDLDVEVVVAETDESELEDDASPSYYFHGFSFDEGMRGYDRHAIFIRGTDRFDFWRAAFKDMLVHEAGHQLFYQRENQDNWSRDQYSSMLFEGHAENLAAAVNQGSGYGWSPPWRVDEPLEIDREQLFEDLEEPRGFGDEEDSKDHDMFLYGGERWSQAEGYTIAYQLVGKILEDTELDLGSVVNVESERWRELVREAAEELY